LLLGEPLTRYKVAGLLLALAAAWLLLGAPAPGDAAGRRESRASRARVLVATVSVGAGQLHLYAGSARRASPGSLIVAQAAVVVTLATVFTAAVDRQHPASGAALRYAPKRPSFSPWPSPSWSRAWRGRRRASWCRSRRWDS